MSDIDKTISRAMRELARRKHAATPPEERSAAASAAAKARHVQSTAAERKALGARLAEARAKKRAKKRKSNGDG